MHAVPTIESVTLRKVYLRLVPFCFLLYILCYIDRINVSFAALTMNRGTAVASRPALRREVKVVAEPGTPRVGRAAARRR
jgi:hypothetical protein